MFPDYQRISGDLRRRPLEGLQNFQPDPANPGSMAWLHTTEAACPESGWQSGRCTSGSSMTDLGVPAGWDRPAHGTLEFPQFLSPKSSKSTVSK